jgi:hypothetical protein
MVQTLGTLPNADSLSLGFKCELEYRSYRISISSHERSDHDQTNYGAPSDTPFWITCEGVHGSFIAKSQEGLFDEINTLKAKIDEKEKDKAKRTGDAETVLAFLRHLHRNINEKHPIGDVRVAYGLEIDGETLFRVSVGEQDTWGRDKILKCYYVEYHPKKNKFRVCHPDEKARNFLVPKNILDKMGEEPEIAKVLANPEYSEREG